VKQRNSPVGDQAKWRIADRSGGWGSAELVALLRSASLPITTAWLLVDTAGHWMVIAVPRKWRDELPESSTTEFVHQIGEVMSETRVGHMCPMTYVLDDDIDPAAARSGSAPGVTHVLRGTGVSTGVETCEGMILMITRSAVGSLGSGSLPLKRRNIFRLSVPSGSSLICA
jgi:hypothetical protein